MTLKILCTNAFRVGPIILPLLAILIFYLWLGQDWPLEWEDEAHFSAVTDSLLRGTFPSVPELSAENGIFWMPFFSNLIHATIYKLLGIDSIYSIYSIRPYIVLPAVAAIYFSLFNLLKVVTKSRIIAALLSATFLTYPAVAGPINTVRQENICILLLIIMVLLCLGNNSISAILTSGIILLTHPIAGIIAFSTLAIWFTSNIKFDIGERQYASRFTFLNYSTKYASPRLKPSLFKDKYKIIFLVIFAAASTVNLYAILAQPDGFTRLYDHLGYQSTRKAGRTFLEPFITILASDGPYILASLISYWSLFQRKLLTLNLPNSEYREQIRSIKISLISGTLLILIPGVIGQEMWYSAYEFLGLFIIMASLFGMGKLAVEFSRKNYQTKNIVRTCFFVSAAMFLYVAITMPSYSFSRMSLSDRQEFKTRKIVSEKVAMYLKDFDSKFQVDGFSFRIMKYQAKKVGSTATLVNIPGAIKDSPHKSNPLILISGTTPHKGVFWSRAGGMSCTSIAESSQVEAYLCKK